MDQRLNHLYAQTHFKSKYNEMDYNIKTPLYTQRMNEFRTPYVRTNQFDKNRVVHYSKRTTKHLKMMI